MTPKIAVYAICKDEAANVAAFLSNVAQADQVVLLDTGSSDDTPQLIVSESAKQGINVTYDEVLIEPFSFSIARNMAMELVSDSIDYMLFLDMDERLTDNWKDTLISCIESVTDQVAKPSNVMLEMIFSKDAEGNPVHVYDQMKVHTKEYTWKYSCHEVLMQINPELNLLSAKCRDVKVTHHKDEDKPRSSYLELLQADAVSIGDQRSYYYYGRELYYEGRYSDAIDVLGEAIRSPNPWAAQTAMSYSLLADCYLELDNSELALPSLYNAAMTNPMHPDHWFDLGYFYYSLNQHHLAIGYLRRTLALEEDGLRTSDYVITDLSKVGWQAHDILANSYYILKDIPNYINHCATAYKLNPSNQRILSNFNDMVAQYGIKQDEDTDTSSAS